MLSKAEILSIMYKLLVNFQIIEDILVVMEEVHTVHSLITNSDVIKHQTVYQALLHPPEQLGFVLHPGHGRYVDVLESEAVQITWASPPLLWSVFSTLIYFACIGSLL